MVVRSENPIALRAPTKPDYPEDNWTKELEASCLQAAVKIARGLAARGEEGFSMLADPSTTVHIDWQKNWTIPEKILYRLAFLADRDVFPAGDLKLASHCGGIKPYPPWQAHCKGTSACADPGNPTYGAVIRRLRDVTGEWRHYDIGVTSEEELRTYGMTTERDLITWRFDFLLRLSEEHQADTIEAALAAADYAYKMEKGLSWTYKDLEGGVWGNGDIPS